ncbi:MAG: putative secreted protein [Paracoccaceae bacterium]|jgi:predicted secreted protein
MTITAALVLFAVAWFMVFFIILPLRVTSQAEAGNVEPGTPRSAPAGDVVAQKARLATLIAIIVWGLLVAIITSDFITVRDLDFMGRMGPPAVEN